jgi:serine/threonine protein kinase
MKTACGTAFYMAPEMLTMSYSEKADIWALGVITYMLLTGRPPFEGKDENTVFDRVRRGHVAYNEKPWSALSPEALEFTKSLLSFDPEKRPSAKQPLELPWLAKYQKRRRAFMDCKDGKVFGKEVCDSLLRFASYPPLKRVALMVVSHHVKEEDTRDLRNMFLNLDEDHSGELTFEEIFNMINKYSVASISDGCFRQVFDQLDQEKTGKVHYMEFLAATLESRVKITGDLLNQAFTHLDVESNGIISIDNLQQLLGGKFTREQVENLIKKGLHHCQYGDHDAIVTKADFIQMMGDAQLPSPSPTPTVPDTPTSTDSNAETAYTESKAESPPATISSVVTPSPERIPLSPPVLQVLIPSTATFVLPTKAPSLRVSRMPIVREETDAYESRAGTPLPRGSLHLNEELVKV